MRALCRALLITPPSAFPTTPLPGPIDYSSNIRALCMRAPLRALMVSSSTCRRSLLVTMRYVTDMLGVLLKSVLFLLLLLGFFFFNGVGIVLGF